MKIPRRVTHTSRSAIFRGYDETNGRFGEVSILRCRTCRRFRLRYFVEYEGFSGSGRWGRGLIDEADIERTTPGNGIEHLHALPWFLYGGSYWGKAGCTSERLRWDL